MLSIKEDVCNYQNIIHKPNKIAKKKKKIFSDIITNVALLNRENTLTNASV